MSKLVFAFRDWFRRIYAFNRYNRDQWVAHWAALVPKGAVVLDVGAGQGRYRNLFAHCTYRAHDFAGEPGTIGRYTALDFISDITAIPTPDQSIDVVLCTEVLEHVPEPILAVKEIARILRPRGLLLMSAPLGSFLHQEPYHFYGGYTPHWYKRFLGEAGFNIDSIEPNQGFFSWFAQETLRFWRLLAPANTRGLSLFRRFAVTLLWLVAAPGVFTLPPIANWLDKLRLEGRATIGYHVRATRLS